MKKESLILAMETSCDETSAAVLKNGRHILSNVISSQVPVHRRFGGVVPEIASRKHIEDVLPVIHEALTTAQVSLQDLSAIAVTYGPGLVGALLVGVSAAKSLAFAVNKPLLGVHHLEGHIFANFLENEALEPPFLALVVSGGHTSLVAVRDYNDLELIGQTRDDAAGEAFDKVARVMGLPYPGGPHIDALAKTGNPEAIHFPRALSQSGSFEFSFSGLKSAVLNHLNSITQKGLTYDKADVAASFQAAVTDVLAQKTVQAVQQYGLNQVVLAGGVAANEGLRKALMEQARVHDFTISWPEPIFCTDNAAMIGCRAHYLYLANKEANLYLNAKPSLKLGCI